MVTLKQINETLEIATILKRIRRDLSQTKTDTRSISFEHPEQTLLRNVSSIQLQIGYEIATSKVQVDSTMISRSAQYDGVIRYMIKEGLSNWHVTFDDTLNRHHIHMNLRPGQKSFERADQTNYIFDLRLEAISRPAQYRDRTQKQWLTVEQTDHISQVFLITWVLINVLDRLALSPVVKPKADIISALSKCRSISEMNAKMPQFSALQFPILQKQDDQLYINQQLLMFIGSATGGSALVQRSIFALPVKAPEPAGDVIDDALPIQP
jgi:hypothetical protein